MNEEMTFMLGNGFGVQVSLRHVVNAPSWLGGPFKWSAKPIYSKTKSMPSGYHLRQAGSEHGLDGIKLSVTNSTMSWFAKTLNKKPGEMKMDKRFIVFMDDFADWLNEIEYDAGGVV